MPEMPSERAEPLLWELFQLSSHTEAEASLYLQGELQRRHLGRRRHVGIHCRRNDMLTLIERTMGVGGITVLDNEMWKVVTQRLQQAE